MEDTSNSVVARALGEGDFDRAARRANFGIVFACACGILMGLALWLLIDPIFTAMNAPPALMPLIRAYMTPYACGFPLSLAIMGFNGVLRGQVDISAGMIRAMERLHLASDVRWPSPARLAAKLQDPALRRRIRGWTPDADSPVAASASAAS